MLKFVIGAVVSHDAPHCADHFSGRPKKSVFLIKAILQLLKIIFFEVTIERSASVHRLS